MDIFCDDEERHQYLQFVKEETKRNEMDILAWCLMTNHVHFIVVPNNETSLARGFGEAHKRYTRMKNFKDNVGDTCFREDLVPAFWMNGICWLRYGMWKTIRSKPVWPDMHGNISGQARRITLVI
ncbi:MAG: hypothetical protein GX147_04830 [Deltaproteobacteria bacterium]|jgi:putative transposase|nr:hypothetical protein [Deltaproteobacteria bacterium]